VRKYRTDDFPVALHVAAEIVSLLMNPQLTTGQQVRVAQEILAFATASSCKSAGGRDTDRLSYSMTGRAIA